MESLNIKAFDLLLVSNTLACYMMIRSIGFLEPDKNGILFVDFTIFIAFVLSFFLYLFG